jgi:hypothetical protein
MRGQKVVFVNVVRWYLQLPQIFKGLIITCSLNLTVLRDQYIGSVSWLNELEGL